MAQATNTSVGQILTSGDFTGTGGSPTLINTGVNAGSYPAVRTVHVDTKGRLTWANGTIDYPLFQPYLVDATDSVRGLMQIGASNNGYVLNVSSGEISFTYPDASATQKGIFKPGTGLSITANTLNADFSALQVATKSSKGVIKTGSGIQSNSGTVSIDNEQLPVASSTVKGIAQAGTGFSISAGLLSLNYGAIAATTSTYGPVQPSGYIKVDANGVLSADTAQLYADEPLATTSSKGMVITGTNINNTSGEISVNTATDTVKGVFSIGDGIAQGTRVLVSDPYDGTPGIVALDRFSFATPTVAGLVRSGWSTGVSGSGVMNLSPGWAAAGWKGLVQIGSGLAVNAGNVTLAESTRLAASDTNLGLVKVNTAQGLSVAGDGTLSFTLGTFPEATTTQKGILQVGTGLTIDGTQTLEIPLATATTKGVLKGTTGGAINPDQFGEIFVGNASTTNLGVVKPHGSLGSKITFAGDGTISVDLTSLPVASAAVKGIAQVTESDGFTVSGGVLSYDKRFASTTVAGICQGDTTTIMSGGGVVYVNATEKAKYQLSSYTLRTKVLGFAPYAQANNVSQISLKEDVQTTTFQISNANGTSYTLPSGTLTTNPPVGSIFKLIITQDATGGASITPSSVLGTTINTAANKITYIKYVVVGANKAIPVEIYTGI